MTFLRKHSEEGQYSYQEAVHIVVPSLPPDKTLTKSQFKAAVRMYLHSTSNKVADCIRLINDTKTPSVFFERLEMLESISKNMCVLEYHFPFNPPLPSEQYKQLQDSKLAAIDAFIDRYYEKAKDKIIKYETMPPKQRTIETFKKSLDCYEKYMFPANVEKYNSLRQELESAAHQEFIPEDISEDISPYDDVTDSSPELTQPSNKQAVRICRKCGSNNINIQAVTHIKRKRHGALWWIFIGWWWLLIKWLVFFLPALIIKLVKGPKYNSVIRSEAVCQNCGYRWRVR